MRAEEVLIFMGTEKRIIFLLCKEYLNLNVCNYQRVCTKKKLCIYMHTHTVTPHLSHLSIHLSNNERGQYYNISI